MQRFAWLWMAVAVGTGGVAGCANEGVGDPCIPEDVPCEGKNGCGFKGKESFLEASSVQCRSRVCIVHKLNVGVGKDDKSWDPRDICGGAKSGPNCVTVDQLNDSVYCTCRCKDGSGKKSESCECPGGFTCSEILSSGPDGVAGSYCVRKPKSPAAMP